MKISSKSRYALVSMIILAKHYDDNKFITLNYISETLDISKIYLEQVFSLLKKADLVISTKGNQGGYRLAKQPSDISVLDIFSFIENNMFSKADVTVLENHASLENAINTLVYEKLDEKIKETLSNITILDLLVEEQNNNSTPMYFL